MAKTGEDCTFWPWFVMMTFHSADFVCSTSLQVKCWLGPASCGLCCRCLPQINESTGTRFMYTLFLVIGFVVASLMLSPQLEQTFIDNVSIMFLCLVLFTATCITINIYHTLSYLFLAFPTLKCSIISSKRKKEKTCHKTR